MHPITLLIRAVRPSLIAMVNLADLLYPRRRVGPILLIDKSVDRHDHGGEPLARLENALMLLRRVDSRRASHAQRYVRRIEIDTIPGRRGVWRARVERCVVSLDLVMGQSLAETASTIVHEVTHARLHGRGFRIESANRARIERCCDREQIRFLRRVPDSYQIVARHEARLDRPPASDEEIIEYDRVDLREHRWTERSIERLLRLRDFLRPNEPD